MPVDFCASVSQRKKGFYSECWVRRITHQTNTVKNTVIQINKIRTFEILKTLVTIKSISAAVRHMELQEYLPEENSFIREVQTKFGSTSNVAKRSLKISFTRSSNYYNSTKRIENQYSSTFTNLSKITNADNIVTYPALFEIKTCFRSLQHAQALLEACEKPTRIQIIL